jgi:hypothetical protein
VADEWALTVALHRALYERPWIDDDVVTLGMAAVEPAIDEDYLMVRASDGRPTATDPVASEELGRWVAEEVEGRGAFIASGIYIGYAGTLAVLLYEHWPTLTHTLLRQLAGSRNGVGEWRVPPGLAREALREAPQQFWDHPPWVAEQVFRVKPCGWSGLRSTRAIARIARPYRNPQNAIAEAARR